MSEHVNAELRQAKAEIKAVMEKYQLGGCVSLHNQTHTEFEFFLPEWSVAKFEKQPDGATGIRIRHKKEDDPEKLVATFHMLFDCRQVCEKMVGLMDGLKDMIRHKVDVENIPFEERN